MSDNQELKFFDDFYLAFHGPVLMVGIIISLVRNTNVVSSPEIVAKKNICEPKL